MKIRMLVGPPGFTIKEVQGNYFANFASKPIDDKRRKTLGSVIMKNTCYVWREGGPLFQEVNKK